MSSRPSPVLIDSGVQGWDALVNAVIEAVFSRPFPPAEHAGDQTDIEATFPADEYRNCLIWVEHTTNGWQLYHSNGTAWAAYSP